MSSTERFKQCAGQASTLLHRTFGDRVVNRLGILAYHCVAPPRADLPESPLTVATRSFREQLAGLMSRGFRFVKLSEVIESCRAKQPLPPKSVLLTFDDGFEAVFRHAFPVLRELDAPGTIFLNTAFLDSEDPFPFDAWSIAHHDRLLPEEYRPLSTDQCRQMAASGLVELGAHTHTHRDFRGRPHELRDDLELCVSILRERFALGELGFSFPYGLVSKGYAGGNLSAVVRAAGLTCAMTTEADLVDPLKDDPYLWGRFIVHPWETASTLAAKLAGWHGWVRQSKKWLRAVRSPRPAPAVSAAAAVSHISEESEAACTIL